MRIATPDDIGHWLAMTSENRKHYRNLGSAPQGHFLRRRFAPPSRRSTQSAWKQCAARHARLNRVGNVVAERCAQSTSGLLSTLTPGDSRGRSPLICLSSISFFKQRKIWSPKGVGQAARPVNKQKKKDPRSSPHKSFPFFMLPLYHGRMEKSSTIFPFYNFS